MLHASGQQEWLPPLAVGAAGLSTRDGGRLSSHEVMAAMAKHAITTTPTNIQARFLSLRVGVP
jgi:hypothetical protein